MQEHKVAIRSKVGCGPGKRILKVSAGWNCAVQKPIDPGVTRERLVGGLPDLHICDVGMVLKQGFKK